MTAEDYVYSIKRLADPENRSPSANFIRGKIVGLDAQVRKAKKTGKFDYDAPVAGLQAMDRYTLRIRLNAPDSNFPVCAGLGALAAVSKEAVDAYGNKDRFTSRSEPVLTCWKNTSRAARSCWSPIQIIAASSGISNRLEAHGTSNWSVR